jgi:leucyl aminopeptidase (aminopeptidase T)
MPGITMDMLQEGAITADYAEVEELTGYYCSLLDEGEHVTIEKENMKLTFSIKGRKGIPSTGVFREKGESGNLPSGESYVAPLEDSANGTIIVDGSIAGIGVIQEPVTLTVQNGRLTDADGEEGKRLLELLGDGNGRVIAEFGIGTNKKARLTGNVLEDEKVFGTVHIAFGSNKPFGGTNEAGVHIDCVIKDPIVTIDDKIIIGG